MYVSLYAPRQQSSGVSMWLEGGGGGGELDLGLICTLCGSVSACVCVCRRVCVWITPRVEKKPDSSSCLQLARAERDSRISSAVKENWVSVKFFVKLKAFTPIRNQLRMIQWRFHSYSQLWNPTLWGGFISSLKLKKKKKKKNHRIATCTSWKWHFF